MPELLDIVGQDSALARLQRAAAGQRRPHAYLFAGPEGVGRRTTAVEFARLLLCEGPAARPNHGRLADLPAEMPLRQGCGQCPSCRTLSAGTHGDFHLVYKELARYHDDPAVRGRVMQDLGIDVIRRFLIAPAYRAATGGRGKVFVVLQAELMSNASQNALLKTLEEPPPGVTIILVCTDPAELLPTTRSRCQAVRFGPLPLEFVAEALAREGVEPAEAGFWAALSGGSVGLAGRLAREKLYPFKRELVDRLADPQGPATGELADLLLKTVEKLARRLRNRDEDLAASLANRQAGELLLRLLTSVYRDALAIACSARRALVHADQPEALARVAGRFDAAALAEVLAQLARYEELLWRNVNAKLLWSNVAITCVSAAAMEV